MSALKSLKIVSLDAFHIAIPLVSPYHLSKVYGTQTHSVVIIVRIMTDSGEEGWGEADPGGLEPELWQPLGTTFERVGREESAVGGADAHLATVRLAIIGPYQAEHIVGR